MTTAIELCSACKQPNHIGSGCKTQPPATATDPKDLRTPMCYRTDERFAGRPGSDLAAIVTEVKLLVDPLADLAPAMRSTIEEAVKMLAIKGRDYTIGQQDVDRLHNFRSAANTLGLPMRTVWAVYFYKHYSAVMRFAKEGQVESEPIQGRIIDCLNYLLLLTLIIEEETRATEQDEIIERGG